jgi:hypothetical protein
MARTVRGPVAVARNPTRAYFVEGSAIALRIQQAHQNCIQNGEESGLHVVPMRANQMAHIGHTMGPPWVCVPNGVRRWI